MATPIERRRKYQDKIQELSSRHTDMAALYRMKQKLEGLNSRFRSGQHNTKTKLRHRESVEELEAQIARRKESSGITMIIDPKKIKSQIDKLRTKIAELEDE